MIGVILPLVLFAYAIHHNKLAIIRLSAFLVVFGIFLNRLNTALITFNWKLPYREIPHWREFVISITVYAIYIVVYRFLLYRLPIFYQWRTQEEPCLATVPVRVANEVRTIIPELAPSAVYQTSLRTETEKI
jgi:Ni/Fe-hydrogenase subunit HybB-like protein